MSHSARPSPIIAGLGGPKAGTTGPPGPAPIIDACLLGLGMPSGTIWPHNRRADQKRRVSIQSVFLFWLGAKTKWGWMTAPDEFIVHNFWWIHLENFTVKAAWAATSKGWFSCQSCQMTVGAKMPGLLPSNHTSLGLVILELFWSSVVSWKLDGWLVVCGCIAL